MTGGGAPGEASETLPLVETHGAGAGHGARRHPRISS